MYCQHYIAGHNAWCKLVNKRYAKAKGFDTNIVPTKVIPVTNKNGDDLKRKGQFKDEAEPKKMTLFDLLCTAMCTQAGLSIDVYDRIWEEACRDSAN